MLNNVVIVIVLVDKNGTQKHHRSYSVSGSLISDLRVLPVDSRSAQISSQIPASDPAVLLVRVNDLEQSDAFKDLKDYKELY